MGQWNLTLPIFKRDMSEGLVTGWAAISGDKDGNPIVDLQGQILPTAELDKAARVAFSYAAGGAGDMHERRGLADLVESFVATKEKCDALGLGSDKEGWIVTLKINDPELRRQIESGEKPELSLSGTAKLSKSGGVATLRDLQLDKTEMLSVVDKGASGNSEHRPRIVLMKRDATADTDPTPGTIQRVVNWLIRKQETPQEQSTMTFDEVLASLDEEKRNVILAAIEAMKKADVEKAEPPEGEKLKDEDEEKATALAKRADLPEDVRKRLDEADELVKRVADLEDAESDRMFVVKAAGLKYLPGVTTEQTVKVLKAAHKLGEAEYKTVSDTLESVAKAVSKLDLLDEVGTSFGADDDSDADISAVRKRVTELRDKNEGMTEQQALVSIAKRDKGAYERYVKALDARNH